MKPKAGCPCDELVHPRTIANLPGLSAVAYRGGAYTSFREALLVPRDGEVALAGWFPSPGSDLGLQLLEWWAYLADVLTFYNERAIQEVLLGTAELPADVRRIVRLLGYRPRPGIGATGVVAALSASPDIIVVPRGFPIEGEAPADGPAQVFEVDTDVKLGVIGQPLPPSARFPALDGAPGTPWIGPAPTEPGGHYRDGVDAQPSIPLTITFPAGGTIEIALDGVITTVAPGDILLVMHRDWAGQIGSGYSVTVVKTVEPAWDAVGHAITQLTLRAAHGLPEHAREDIVVLKPTKSSHLWLYHQRYPGSTSPALIAAAQVANVLESIFDPGGLFTGGGGAHGPPEDPRVFAGVQMLTSGAPHGVAHLEAITRGIAAGDPVLFEKRAGGGIAGLFEQIAGGVAPGVLDQLRMLVMQLVQVRGYAEDIWYANAPQLDRVGFGPPIGPPTHGLLQSGEGPIPIPHSRITFDPNPFIDVMALGDTDLDKIVMHYGWQEIGTIVPPPPSKRAINVTISRPTTVPPDAAVPAIVVDNRNRGVPGWLGRDAKSPGDALVPPLRALFNLLPVSRGKTVTGEVLGSGTPGAINQELVLSRAPLTYLADTGPRSTIGYRSTLRIRVDGIEWLEVPSFYGQPPTARVFVTFEDDEAKTHVRFGDGEHGARLPAGLGNVVADYRYGSGAATPPPGTLTSILRPLPGLTGIVDALPVGGGEDPDPPERIRRYAPRSVLTFGRAISGDDYETVAAQTPGVRRARAKWGWDAAAQRSIVTVFVGDDDAAVANAREALRSFGDPNRHVDVVLAAPIAIDVQLRAEVDPAYDPAAVKLAVIAALLDPQAQPFGREVVQIGQVIYDSQIVDACMRVPGVVAVHGLRFGRVTIVPAPPPPPSAPPPTSTAPQLPAAFGADFDTAELYDPLILAWRLGIEPAVLSDPSELAVRVAAAATPAAITAAAPTTIVVGEAGPRHIPAGGRFFLLDEANLHVEAEVARHVL